MINRNIDQLTLENENYRKVIETTDNMQVVLMSINIGEIIPMEVHNVDQFFKIVYGSCEIIISNKSNLLREDDYIIVNLGSYHQVTNIGPTKLKLYTIYTPPNHFPNTVHKTKLEADKYEKTHENTHNYKNKYMKYLCKYQNLINK